MSTTYYVVILLIGSMTLSKKIRELATSIKTQNKEKIKVDIFFLFLTVALIALLVLLEESSKKA
jgi:hypothetical protein